MRAGGDGRGRGGGHRLAGRRAAHGCGVRRRRTAGRLPRRGRGRVRARCPVPDPGRHDRDRGQRAARVPDDRAGRPRVCAPVPALGGPGLRGRRRGAAGRARALRRMPAAVRRCRPGGGHRRADVPAGHRRPGGGGGRERAAVRRRRGARHPRRAAAPGPRAARLGQPGAVLHDFACARRRTAARQPRRRRGRPVALTPVWQGVGAGRPRSRPLDASGQQPRLFPLSAGAASASRPSAGGASGARGPAG